MTNKKFVGRNSPSLLPIVSQNTLEQIKIFGNQSTAELKGSVILQYLVPCKSWIEIHMMTPACKTLCPQFKTFKKFGEDKNPFVLPIISQNTLDPINLYGNKSKTKWNGSLKILCCVSQDLKDTFSPNRLYIIAVSVVKCQKFGEGKYPSRSPIVLQNILDPIKYVGNQSTPERNGSLLL